MIFLGWFILIEKVELSTDSIIFVISLIFIQSHLEIEKEKEHFPSTLIKEFGSFTRNEDAKDQGLNIF